MLESTVFTMHPGMDGPHNFGVHLKTNDPINPDLIVTLLSNWIPQNITEKHIGETISPMFLFCDG